MSTELTPSEREQISTILSRRANEVAGYKDDHSENRVSPVVKPCPASVDFALELEIKRLRRLAEKVNPTQLEPEE